MELSDSEYVTTGIIFSPNYESGAYGNDGESELCKIVIKVQSHRHIILQLNHNDSNISGPCLQDMVIGGTEIKGKCPEQSVRSDSGETSLTLNRGKQLQPSFTITVTGMDKCRCYY